MVSLEPGVVQTRLHDNIEAAKTRAGVSHPLLAEDVANTILFIVQQPPHVTISEILIRPTSQRV